MSQYLQHCTNVITKKSGLQGASDILLIFTVVLSNGSPGGGGCTNKVIPKQLISQKLGISQHGF